MIRKAFLMSLHPGSREEYIRRHSPIWEDLENTLENHGVTNYSIFFDSEKNCLFAYAEIESEELWRRIAETDSCQRWWKFMKDLMPTNDDNRPVSRDLEEVFHLD